MSGVTFPNETSEYRVARDRLLAAEIELRQQVGKVAELRRAMPLGGVVGRDYVFEESAGSVRLSQLFEPGKEALFIYSLMFGPEMAEACPMCSSFLDALDGNARHLAQRINLAVVARSPIQRLNDFGKRRGWRHLRLLSAAGNTYSQDYLAENEAGAQMPMANVFVRRDGEVRHFWGSEMLYAGLDGDPRHIDAMWPLWNILDTVPEGRGTDWYPSL